MFLFYSSGYPRTIRTLTLSIDGANRTLTGGPFNYTADPTVMEIKPLKSFMSGGRMITVHGTNLDTIQNPMMMVYIVDDPTPINITVSCYYSKVQLNHDTTSGGIGACCGRLMYHTITL